MRGDEDADFEGYGYGEDIWRMAGSCLRRMRRRKGEGAVVVCRLSSSSSSMDVVSRAYCSIVDEPFFLPPPG